MESGGYMETFVPAYRNIFRDVVRDYELSNKYSTHGFYYLVENGL
jgi:hypothetical protein